MTHTHTHTHTLPASTAICRLAICCQSKGERKRESERERKIKTKFSPNKISLFVVVCAMGKKTALHRAAERGDSEKLKFFLDEGMCDVNEESDEKYYEGVSLQRERKKRERAV